MKKILIVDDEDYIRELLLSTLEEEDYTIFQAGDGEKALEKARKEKPDIMLLDVEIPKVSGYEVCRRLKSDPETKSIAIIMLTGLGQESQKRKGEEMGADDYFVKPFSPLSLLDKVKEVLGE